MGAHHAPADRARHGADAPTSAPRLGRLAGTGVLTASAALAMTGAGSGVALAHDSDEDRGTLGDNDVSLLCGILGGDECSSDSDDAGRDSDAGSDDDTRSLFDRMSSDEDDQTDDADRSGDTSSSDSGGSPSAARSVSSATAQPAAAPTQRPSLDTPPPPGQIRTIQVPG